MKRPAVLIIFIFVTILGLGIVQMSVANQISTTGAELAELQKEVETYKRKNAILQEELLAAASLTTIAEEAEELGYTEAKSQLSLTSPLPLARR
ncbi:MAG TPA: hypothetical protein VLF20_00970 [Patescibacteria group bacterium]|nr:hypothetical protein [Patescibacteria group bacterium]